MFEKGIFLLVFQHPARQHGATARDNAKDPVLFCAHAGSAVGNSAVQGHEIHALFGLFLNLGKELFRIHGRDFALVVQKLLAYRVERHSTQGQVGALQHAGADGVEISCNGKIHHSVSACGLGHMELFYFHVVVAAQGRCADVGVDLDGRGLAHQDGPHFFVGRIAQQHHGALFNAF